MTTYNDAWLAHHGIKGQRWGVRRFQNEDGSLKPAGEKRYYNRHGELNRKGVRRLRDEMSQRQTEETDKYNEALLKTVNRQIKKQGKPVDYDLLTEKINSKVDKYFDTTAANIAKNDAYKRYGKEVVDKAMQNKHWTDPIYVH